MSIEKKYQKLDDIDHILKRSGMYVGSIKLNTSDQWILDNNKFIKRQITYNPAFIKIFDEILINSIDESKRSSKLNIIKIDVNKDYISIRDNGGIEVIKHKDYNEWIPEMIFSNLKAGSNFDDSKDRVGAGTNGVGSVLTNVFSKQFIVSTCDGKKSFYQEFSNNMRNRKEPIIKSSKINHTEIRYTPDYEKFGIEVLNDDHLRIIEKRVYDIAACNSKLKIYFNGSLVDISSFDNYIKLYTDSYIIDSNKEKNWIIGISDSDNGFQQVSFVNSIETYDGGTHVDYILNQIIVYVKEFMIKKHKIDLKPSEIKNHIFLFLNSTVINPSFSSQTKEKLITESKAFGIQFELTEKFKKDILKSEIINRILDWNSKKLEANDAKLTRELNKSLSKIKVDKLIDAKGKIRTKCVLGIYEGDCLHEDTLVRVLRNGDMINIPISKIDLGDLVITHNNTFQEVSALTRKIEYKNIIKTKLGDIISSNKHQFFVYDIEKNEFYFEKLSNIDKSKHKLVKNQLCFMDALLEIESINNNNLILKSGESLIISYDHKMCVYNKKDDKFEMVDFLKLNINDYLIVNTFGIS
jgi:DNA topoisomerase-2